MPGQAWSDLMVGTGEAWSDLVGPGWTLFLRVMPGQAWLDLVGHFASW